MKKLLKVILIIIATILILLGLMVVISLASYWKETSLLKEKFKALPAETVEIESSDEYKEIMSTGLWGFALPSKQVAFSNSSLSTPCWALGNTADFLYTSSVVKKQHYAEYTDTIYAKADFEFPQLDADSVSEVKLSNKAFHYLQSYDAENKQFVWNEGTTISCDFDKNTIKNFCGFLDNNKFVKAENDNIDLYYPNPIDENNGTWYISDLEENSSILCHERKPYGFIIRLYFNDNLYNQEYMLCKTDKGKYIVISDRWWNEDYHTNYVYLLPKDLNDKMEQLLSNVDFCNETQNTFDECKDFASVSPFPKVTKYR